MKFCLKYMFFLILLLTSAVNIYSLAPKSADMKSLMYRFSSILADNADPRKKTNPKKDKSEISEIIQRMKDLSVKRKKERFARYGKQLKELKINLDGETLFSDQINGVKIRDFLLYYREGLLEEMLKAYRGFYKNKIHREYRAILNKRYRMANKAMKDFIPYYENLAEKYFTGEEKKLFLWQLNYSTHLIKKESKKKSGTRKHLAYWATEMQYLQDEGIIPDIKTLNFLNLKIFPVDNDGNIRVELLKDWLFSKQRSTFSKKNKSWPPEMWFRYLKANRLQSLSEILEVSSRDSIPEEPRQLSLFEDFDVAV